MPSIPQSKRLVQEQVFQRPDTSTAGPRVGQSDRSAARLGQSLEKVNNVYIDFRDKADKIELDSFKTRLREKQNKLTHDREQGFLNVRGKDTVTRSDEYLKDYDEFADEEIKALGSDRVKAIATQMKEELRVGYNKQLMSHTSREMEIHDNEQTKANLTSIRDTAILNYKESPEGIGKAIDEQKQVLAEFAERKGMSSKQKDIMFKEAESEMHAGVIYQAIADDNDLLAGEHFKTARKDGKLTAKDTLQLEKAVDQASRIGESQRFTADVIQEMDALKESKLAKASKVGDKGSKERAAAIREAESFNPSTMAIAKAREKIEDPKLKDETVRRIKLRYAEMSNLKNKQINETFQDIAVIAEKEGLDKAKKHPSWWDLKLSHRDSIEKRNKQVLLNKQPKTDVLLYSKLKIQGATPQTRNDFIATPLEQYRHKLSDRHYMQLADMKASLIKGRSDQADGSFSELQSAKDAMKLAGISGDLAEAEFRVIFDDRIREWKRTNNKEIGSEDLKKIAKDLTVEVVTDKGLIYDTTVPKYKLSEEQVNALTVDDVPDKDYDQIVDVLKKQGKQVTAEEVLKMYKTVTLGSNG